MTLYEAACKASEKVAEASGHPTSQISFLALCGAYIAFGGDILALTTFLSILAISLSQMVLNRQDRKEADAIRRDKALHAKVDELVIATAGARDELAHIEEQAEDIIEEKRA